jgi:hypothetical protein
MKHGHCRATFVIGATLVSLLAGTEIAQAQSLADVAKQEEARRKAVKKPAKVYTNGSLTPVPGEVIPTPPAPRPEGEAQPESVPGAEPAKDTPSADEATSDPKQTPGYWKKRMVDAVEARDNNQLMIDALQSRVNALLTDFTNRDDPAQRALIAADRQKALDELERRKKEQEQLEKAILDLEDEARRAGVPPGWLR